MDVLEADTKAKALYGPKAFCKIGHSHDIAIDQSWTEDGKQYYHALLLGWGDTWEEAFALAEQRAPIHKAGKPPDEYKQIKMF